MYFKVSCAKTIRQLGEKKAYKTKQNLGRKDDYNKENKMVCSVNLTITELRSPISLNRSHRDFGRQVVKCQKITGFSREKNRYSHLRDK